MKTTFYIALHTKEYYDPIAYKEQAENMQQAITLFFDELKAPSKFCKPHTTISSCHTEAEMSQGLEGLIGKCVLDIVASPHVQFDKSTFSKLFKAATDWPALRIEKRNVDMELRSS